MSWPSQSPFLNSCPPPSPSHSCDLTFVRLCCSRQQVCPRPCRASPAALEAPDASRPGCQVTLQPPYHLGRACVVNSNTFDSRLSFPLLQDSARAPTPATARSPPRAALAASNEPLRSPPFFLSLVGLLRPRSSKTAFPLIGASAGSPASSVQLFPAIFTSPPNPASLSRKLTRPTPDVRSTRRSVDPILRRSLLWSSSWISLPVSSTTDLPLNKVSFCCTRSTLALLLQFDQLTPYSAPCVFEDVWTSAGRPLR
ncbi:hypothetical protein BKA81DRAFT_187722 [Phyllosticta paracitricarpa]